MDQNAENLERETPTTTSTPTSTTTQAEASTPTPGSEASTASAVVDEDRAPEVEGDKSSDLFTEIEGLGADEDGAGEETPAADADPKLRGKGKEAGQPEVSGEGAPPSSTDGSQATPTPLPTGQEAKPGPGAAQPDGATPTPTPGPTPTPSATPTPAAAPTKSFEEVQQDFGKWKGEAQKLLAEHVYALPPEQVKELEDEGVSPALLKAVPNMMARVYLDSVQAAMGQIVANLPQLIVMVTNAQAQARQQEDGFYKQWPQLKEHHDTVLRIATAYRKQNPTAKAQDFVNEVGAASMIALRLPIGGTPVVTPPATQAKAFRPAGPARTPGKPLNQQKNAFTELFEEDLAEEGNTD